MLAKLHPCLINGFEYPIFTRYHPPRLSTGIFPVLGFPVLNGYLSFINGCFVDWSLCQSQSIGKHWCTCLFVFVRLFLVSHCVERNKTIAVWIIAHGSSNRRVLKRAKRRLYPKRAGVCEDEAQASDNLLFGYYIMVDTDSFSDISSSRSSCLIGVMRWACT